MIIFFMKICVASGREQLDNDDNSGIIIIKMIYRAEDVPL